MRIVNNTLFAPFYIFIKFGYQVPDEVVIDKLGIKDYLVGGTEKHTPKEGFDIWDFYITEVDNWTHIMDENYELWADKNIRQSIEEIALQGSEVFYCSFGDMDDAFDFVYYQNGLLRRKYVLEYTEKPTYTLTENIGKPLLNEETTLKLKDSWQKVTTLASSIGINLTHHPEHIKRYGLERKSFQFNEGEY